jgi:hypothetical protein
MLSTFLASVHNIKNHDSSIDLTIGADNNKRKFNEFLGHSTEIRTFEAFFFRNVGTLTKAYKIYSHQ